MTNEEFAQLYAQLPPEKRRIMDDAIAYLLAKQREEESA